MRALQRDLGERHDLREAAIAEEDLVVAHKGAALHLVQAAEQSTCGFRPSAMERVMRLSALRTA